MLRHGKTLLVILLSSAFTAVCMNIATVVEHGKGTKQLPDLARWVRGLPSADSQPRVVEDTISITYFPLNTKWSMPRNPIFSVVVVSPEVIEGWQFLYRFITETEFVLCLEGYRHEGRIYVTNFRMARLMTTSIYNVRYLPCESPRYIGTAHNHAPVYNSNKNLCYQSEPDRRSFGMDQRAIIDVVLCGDMKFRWWLKDGRTGREGVTAFSITSY